LSPLYHVDGSRSSRAASLLSPSPILKSQMHCLLLSPFLVKAPHSAWMFFSTLSYRRQVADLGFFPCRRPCALSYDFAGSEYSSLLVFCRDDLFSCIGSCADVRPSTVVLLSSLSCWRVEVADEIMHWRRLISCQPLVIVVCVFPFSYPLTRIFELTRGEVKSLSVLFLRKWTPFV